MISEQVVFRNLPMTVLDVEYQFDRHKLVFFFEADRRIDFRELVSELFSLYKTRIWMQQVDTSILSDDDPGTIIAKKSGLLPDRGTPLDLPKQESYFPGPRLGSSLMSSRGVEWHGGETSLSGAGGLANGDAGNGGPFGLGNGEQQLRSLDMSYTMTWPPGHSLGSPTTSSTGSMSQLSSGAPSPVSRSSAMSSPLRSQDVLLQSSTGTFPLPGMVPKRVSPANLLAEVSAPAEVASILPLLEQIPSPLSPQTHFLTTLERRPF